jgi:D-alanyl-D-alanine carboxypeptidase (penicillin-binding protein 5/6)
MLTAAVVAAALMPVSAAALTDPAPVSGAAVLADTETGNILYVKNGDERVYPASTTKIMTVLLAVEAVEALRFSLGDMITAGSGITTGLTEDGSTAGIVQGEEISLEELLYCAMLASANEACNVIAEYVSGSVAAFVDLMNERAGELGCTETSFTNTHGLPDYNHYTTANDLARIALEAVNHPLFMEICGTVTWPEAGIDVPSGRRLTNTNGLINADSTAYPGYYYEYARGIKTGHTQDAGYCLVSSAEKEGVSLLCVVMGGRAVDKVEKTEFTNFTDSIALYDWGFENFAYRDILETTDLIADIPVKMGRDSDYVSVRPETAVRALMAADEDNSDFEQNRILYSEKNGEELVAPIEAGTVLGEISISRDGRVYGSSRLVAASSVDVNLLLLFKANVSELLRNPLVIAAIFIVLVPLVIYIFLVLRYYRSRRAYVKRMRAGRAAPPPAQSHQEQAPPPPEETQAERDYFNEFFNRNGK